MACLLGVVAGKTDREIVLPAVVVSEFVSSSLVALRAKLENDLVQRPLTHLAPPWLKDYSLIFKNNLASISRLLAPRKPSIHLIVLNPPFAICHSDSIAFRSMIS